MNMTMVKRIYCHSAKLDLWLLHTIYPKDQVCSCLTLFVGGSFSTSLFCVFNKSKENPDHPGAFPPSHPALPSHPLHKPPHSLCKWFLWSILFCIFNKSKENPDPSWWWNPPRKQTPLRFNSIDPSIILWFISWLTHSVQYVACI
jgi:hypothetical protein